MAEIEAPGSGRSSGFSRAISARRGGLSTALALVAVGLFFVWQALRMRLGDVALPGPGFFPLVLGTVLAGFAAWIAWGLWRERDGGEVVELGHRDVLIALAAMLAVPPLFERLGAYVTLGLFAVTLLVLIARAPLLRAAVAATAGMAACWLFFQVLLGLQLPRGPF